MGVGVGTGVVFDEGTVDMVVKVLVEVGVVMVVSVGVVMIMIALEAVMSCSSRSKVLTAPLHLRGSPSELDLPAKQKKRFWVHVECGVPGEFVQLVLCIVLSRDSVALIRSG